MVKTVKDEELLEKVKQGLSVSGSFNDNTLKIKILAVKQYMLNAGITQDKIESDLGIATLTVGVMDLWSLSSGEVKFSYAFDMCLMPQLKAASMQ
jgi:hypothetical protein